MSITPLSTSSSAAMNLHEQQETNASSSSEILVFNHHPLAARIFGGIYALAIGLFGLYELFFGQGFADGWFFSILAPGVVLWLLIGRAILTQVEELRIDFAQRVYEHRTGNLPDSLITTGSLDDVDCLRFGAGHHPGGRGGPGFDYFYLELLWSSNHPHGLADTEPTAASRILTLELSQSPVTKNKRGKGFELKSEAIGPFGKPKTKAKQEMKAYAGELAARLRVPIIDETEG